MGKMLRCWRPGHTTGTARQGMGIDSAQQVKCFLCDDRQLSNLDLVAEHEGISLQQAAEWMLTASPCPRQARARSASGKGPLLESKTIDRCRRRP